MQTLCMRPKALRRDMQVFKVQLDFQIHAAHLVSWSGLLLSTSASSAGDSASAIQHLKPYMVDAITEAYLQMLAFSQIKFPDPRWKIR